MALTTYDGLQAEIADWLERSDATTRAPTWIAMCEARLKRLLRTRDTVIRATAEISDEYSAVPTDFVAPRTMRLTASPFTPLQYLTANQMAEIKAQLVAGPLAYYALIGEEFEFAPIPTAATQVELTYFAKFASLSATQPSNWVLAAHPDAYLHGSMMEAGVFYQDDDMVAKHEPLFGTAIDEINRAARRDEHGVLTPSASTRPV